jgi:hypothetical protein
MYYIVNMLLSYADFSHEADAQLLALVVLGDAAGVSPATFFLVPFLKSVSYQPPPFNLKPAADICFDNSGLLQAGQSVNTGSLSFCKASYL